MDPQQQFCLKWNSFGNNLVATFDNLFKSSSLTDVTLFCEGVTFQAHRLILAACSKHFQDLFESAPLSPSILVILDGTSSSNMSSLLEFMYKGEVHVAQESLPSFLKAAEYLQVKGLSVDHDKIVPQPASHMSPSVLEPRIDSPNSRLSAKLNKLPFQQQQQQQQQQNIIGKPEERTCSKSISSGGGTGTPETEPVYSPASSSTLASSYPIYHVSSPHNYKYDPRTTIPTSATTHCVPSVSSASGYEMMPRKRPHHQRSPSDPMKDNVQRASVLRDGSKPERESPVTLGFAPIPPPLPPASSLPAATSESSSSSSHHFDSSLISHNLPPSSVISSADMTTSAAAGSFEQTAAVDKSPSPNSWSLNSSNCAEDLRIKCEQHMESTGSGSLDENSAERKYYGGGGGGGGNLECGQRERELNDRIPPLPPLDLLAQSPSGSGKKLQCPYCERLYGYETNLRAHVRQRHQGIRVPCPYCTRTFTRNNTVRRHIAREHKTELGFKPLSSSSSSLAVHPHNSQQQQQQ